MKLMVPNVKLFVTIFQMPSTIVKYCYCRKKLILSLATQTPVCMKDAVLVTLQETSANALDITQVS